MSKYKALNDTIENKLKVSLYELILLMGCFCGVILMYVRAFFGTEITDEAFYISDAFGMIQGNVPYAYNNFSYGTGAAFLLIPQLFIYKILVPDMKGVVLFTRLSYVTFRFFILLYFYHVLKKCLKKQYALLALGFMLPFLGAVIQNYSYNTIPTMLSLLSGMLLYDAIEQKCKRSKFKILFAGFTTGIAVFAHPGYGVGLLVFFPLLWLRSNKGNKVKNFMLYCLGGIGEILVVFIPIMIRVGVDVLAAGIGQYIHPYPSKPMAAVSKVDQVISLISLSFPILLFSIGAMICVVPFGMRYVRENEKKLNVAEYIQLGISAGIFVSVVWIIKSSADVGCFYFFGILATVYVCIYIVAFKLVFNPLFYYIALYPVLFSVAELMVVDSGMTYERFYYALPALCMILLLALGNKSELVRMLATATVIVAALAMFIADFQFVYRDESLPQLDCIVEDGVYAGIFTTKERARDLVELERYLNSAIDENEYFAFRDNVPCGYLMVHNGKMCDVCTWDILQYTYRKNEPAQLFDYYKRRNVIPHKIIYVDYGRDENLSIEDSAFRYNDFVNEYYTLIDDVKMNDTFRHVMVFKYNGQFDGNYDYWIDTYMGIADENNGG